jgi:hypothetical protein
MGRIALRYAQHKCQELAQLSRSPMRMFDPTVTFFVSKEKARKRVEVCRSTRA